MLVGPSNQKCRKSNLKALLPFKYRVRIQNKRQERRAYHESGVGVPIGVVREAGESCAELFNESREKGVTVRPGGLLFEQLRRQLNELVSVHRERRNLVPEHWQSLQQDTAERFIAVPRMK